MKKLMLLVFAALSFGLISPALAGDAFQQAQASNPGMKPYFVMQGLFNQATAAATFTDFGLDRHCYWAKATDLVPEDATFPVSDYFQVAEGTAGTPSYGPLFPGTPPTPPHFISGVQLSMQFVTPDNIAYGDLGPFDAADFVVNQTSKDFIETVKVEDEQGQGSKNASYVMDARKTGDWVVVHLTFQDVPIYINLTGKTYLQNYDAYAYCY